MRGTPEKEKMSLAAMVMSGCAHKWWCWWSPRHPGVSWNTFTTTFLWRFKPDYRVILPIFDKEDEPAQESSSLMELNGNSQETLNDVLQAWDEFLSSTTQIEVPTVREKNLMVATVTPTSDFKGGILALPDATIKKLIDTPESLGGSKIDVECHASFDCALKLEAISEIQLTRKPLVRSSPLLKEAIYPLSVTRSSPIFAPPPKPSNLPYCAVANPPPPPAPPNLSYYVVEYEPWSQNWVSSLLTTGISIAWEEFAGLQLDPLPTIVGRTKPNSIKGWVPKKWGRSLLIYPQRGPRLRFLALELLPSCMGTAAVMATGAYGRWVENGDVANTLGKRTREAQDQYDAKLNLVKGEMQHVYEENGHRYFAALSAIATVSCGHCHHMYDSEVVAHHFSTGTHVVVLILEVNFSFAFSVVKLSINSAEINDGRFIPSEIKNARVRIMCVGTIIGLKIIEAVTSSLPIVATIAIFKLVGARHFAASIISKSMFDSVEDYASTFDGDGHGTHMAYSEVGHHGISVVVAEHNFGNACGMSPCSNIVVYKAFYKGFGGFVVVATSDRAIQYRMDITCLSIIPNRRLFPIILIKPQVAPSMLHNATSCPNARKVSAGPTEILGVLILQTRGLLPEAYWYWIGVGALLGYVFLFTSMYTLAFQYLNPFIRDQAGLSEEKLLERNASTAKAFFQLSAQVKQVVKVEQEVNGLAENCVFDSYAFGSLQFQQWDPGGCSLVHWKGPLDLEAIWKDATITQMHCPNFNLEIKVDFNGGGNVMIPIEEKGKRMPSQQVEASNCNRIRKRRDVRRGVSRE